VTIKVVVADDQELLRAGLCGIIGTDPGLAVAAQAATGAEAVHAVRTECPDVVLMDIRMPGMDGLAATRVITSTSTARVLILTTFDLDEYVYAALRGGASGFLLKDTPPRDLLTAVHVVAAGDAMLSPPVTRRLIAEFVTRSPTPTAPPLDGITPREREVLLLVAEGLSNTEIAERLFIGAGTVKSHIAHLLTKLDARDRVQLAIHAFRSGLIDPRK
jgi:DNA-binding NarL/FixJ family response regulator